MARKPRFNLAGMPQHVVQRGNNRSPCFFGIHDFRRYLQFLNDAATNNSVAVHAYVLMDNHVHLLATPKEKYGITHMMQDLGRKYVPYFNFTHERSGTLWEGRFKASLVDSDVYALSCMRYIEMNPVRASIVDHPRDYEWSSYRRNAQGCSNQLIQNHPTYQVLGGTEYKRQKAYRGLFDDRLSDNDVILIREALGRELVLGRDSFKDKIERRLNRQTRPGKVGRPGSRKI